MSKVELQFYAYCFKTIKNSKRNYIKRKKLYIDLQNIVEGRSDYYFGTSFFVSNYEFCFYNLELVEALNKISKEKRDILLLYYCGEMRDVDIAKVVMKPRSTVNYKRRVAIDELRKYYKEFINE